MATSRWPSRGLASLGRTSVEPRFARRDGLASLGASLRSAERRSLASLGWRPLKTVPPRANPPGDCTPKSCSPERRTGAAHGPPTSGVVPPWKENAILRGRKFFPVRRKLLIFLKRVPGSADGVINGYFAINKYMFIIQHLVFFRLYICLFSTVFFKLGKWVRSSLPPRTVITNPRWTLQVDKPT